VDKGSAPVIKINGEEVPWSELESSRTRIYLTRVAKVAFVRDDADVHFQYVAEVIDRAHHAGAQRVGLMTRDRTVAGE